MSEEHFFKKKIIAIATTQNTLFPAYVIPNITI
jgi:hypothetical protein